MASRGQKLDMQECLLGSPKVNHRYYTLIISMGEQYMNTPRSTEQNVPATCRINHTYSFLTREAACKDCQLAVQLMMYVLEHVYSI